MPVVAHIDDEKPILRSAESVCKSLALAMAKCEEWIRIEENRSNDVLQRTEALLDLLKDAKLLPDYEIVATLMATSSDLISSVTFLDEEDRHLRLIETSEQQPSTQEAQSNSSQPNQTSVTTSAPNSGTGLVLTAESQEEFLQKVVALKPHQKPRLVLLDLKLTEGDDESGLKVLTEIQKSEYLGKVPVIMMTQFYDKTTIKMSYSRGASSYVLKGGINFKQNLIRVLATWLILARLPADAPVAQGL